MARNKKRRFKPKSRHANEFNRSQDQRNPSSQQRPHSENHIKSRPRFDLPQDEFDKIYRGGPDGDLDPNMAIKIAKMFEPDRASSPPKKCGIVFFANSQNALDNISKIQDYRNQVDELHISLAAEGQREDPQLIQWAKVFSGNAWLTVLQRRVQEGWYIKNFSSDS